MQRNRLEIKISSGHPQKEDKRCVGVSKVNNKKMRK